MRYMDLYVGQQTWELIGCVVVAPREKIIAEDKSHEVGPDIEATLRTRTKIFTSGTHTMDDTRSVREQPATVDCHIETKTTLVRLLVNDYITIMKPRAITGYNWLGTIKYNLHNNRHNFQITKN